MFLGGVDERCASVFIVNFEHLFPNQIVLNVVNLWGM